MINFSEINAGLGTFEKMREEIMHLSEENSLKYQETDIRFSFPNQLNRLLIFTDLNLFFFERDIKKKKILDTFLSTNSDSDHFDVMSIYISMTRISFVMGLCTILERYIRKLAETIEKEETSKENIFKIRERLFRKLNIEKDSELWKAQKILFLVRNTSHNNSIYTGEKYEEILYASGLHIFKKGFVHNSADFKTLCFILNDVIKFYHKTLEIEEIKNVSYIPEELMFNFGIDEN